ncbi:SGNH/GDSL hydrolase family protein [Blastopirellula marina]|uniref:SGNH/GDSL hydrolase family protein n=1 Tax=Blastopirellula marina TaxID=124 RepID=UPI001304FEA9|nr:SGNH/GDSL hydrolase family protein [Blastopirellula marina]
MAASVAVVLTLLASNSLFAQSGDAGASKLALRDGDRIALIGGTFIERTQYYGYFELAIQIANPDKKLAIRNLGWSGDEATAISRARFGDQKEGYNHLMKSVELVNPTVILLGYGTNEAFQGEGGLESFKANYTKLLDDLKKRTERIVLVTPPLMEKHPTPLPDPAQYNANVKLYQQAIEELAYDRGYQVLDLTNLTEASESVTAERLPKYLTSNGQHFTDVGYWYLSQRMADQLGFETSYQHDVKSGGEQTQTWQLPYPRSPVGEHPGRIVLQVEGLSPGEHTIGLNDYPKVAETAKQWSKSVQVPAQPLMDKTEELRQAILRKNQLFFDRFRPQNETYLYLFRKHEQGNNAVEIPQFDPLIEEQDKKIFELKQPVPVTVHID